MKQNKLLVPYWVLNALVRGETLGQLKDGDFDKAFNAAEKILHKHEQTPTSEAAE